MEKGTKRNIFIAATYAITLILGIILGQNYVDQQGNSPNNSLIPIGFYDNSYKVQQVLDLLVNNYVDSLDMDSLQDGAINHIISHLDPYSNYLLPNASQIQNATLDGTFEGIGLEYYSLNDTLLVVGVISNGPAEKGGIKVGDKIIRIDTSIVSGRGISLKTVDKLIRGKKGSPIELFVSRREEFTNRPFKLKRGQVNVSSIDLTYMLEPTIGYIKIRRFGLKTDEEFRNALIELKKQGASNLILDLRDNSGGYFHVAVRVASEFFKDKKLLVYTQGAHVSKRDYMSDGTGQYPEGKLVVLINDKTASASEIVAGAVQDWDRAAIIGRQSYGKGIVQEQFDFLDGSRINLSIAQYYTPLGRSIQRAYKANWSNMAGYANMYHGLWALDTTYAKRQLFTTQGGRELYSGGGITPDYMVPIDSNVISLLYQNIVRSNYIEQFVYERFTKQSPAYSIENFILGYHLPIEEYNDFIDYLKAREIEVSDRKKNDLLELIQSDIEAIVARYYYGREAYFKVKNRNDPFLEKAKEILIPNKDV